MTGSRLAGCRCGKSVIVGSDGDLRVRTAFGSMPMRATCCRSGWDDHDWYGDESSDFRCYDCDRRFYSHGAPAPAGSDFVRALTFTARLRLLAAPVALT